MAGRHSRRVRSVPARVPMQHGPRWVGITDACTHVEHLVSDESVMTHRQSGTYLALCGAPVLAASLTDPGRVRCRECVS